MSLLLGSSEAGFGSLTRQEAYVVNGTLSQNTTKATIRLAMRETFELAPMPNAMAKPRLSNDRRIPVVYARTSTWISYVPRIQYVHTTDAWLPTLNHPVR